MRALRRRPSLPPAPPRFAQEERCGSGFQPRSDGARQGDLLHKGVTPRRDPVTNVAGGRGRGSGISFQWSSGSLYETSCRQGVLSTARPKFLVRSNLPRQRQAAGLTPGFWLPYALRLTPCTLTKLVFARWHDHLHDLAPASRA